MSTIDPSMENMLVTFIDESTSLLEELDEILLESEKSKSIEEKNINEIFRIMHTIKGSAAMMGLEEISNFAHTIEDIFFIIRQEPAKLALVIQTIFDPLFQSSDFLKTEIDIIQGGAAEHQDPSALTKKLEAQMALMNEPAAAEEVVTPEDDVFEPFDHAELTQDFLHQDVAPPVYAAAADGFHQIRVFFEDDCLMENIRAFALLSQIKDCCDEIESDPPNPERDSSLSAKIVKDGLLIRFKTTGNPGEVYEIIENAVNVKSYELVDEQPHDILQLDEALYHLSSSVVTNDESTPKIAAATPASTGQSSGPKIAKQNLISVNQTKLDQLMDLVGEIVTAESMVSSNPDLRGLTLDNFYKSTRELRKLTDELQDVVMSIRMVPLSGTFQKMNRIVRDVSKKLDKQVELETIGGDTEVDKTINDSLSDPLMHMIRNSVDHAIESPEQRRALGKPECGKITLSAQNIGGEIVITISDDGCGLDTEVLMKKAKANGLLVKAESEYTDKEIFNFIMLPGFSTNAQVTEFSGRGVGMDVVRKNLEKVGGTISIDSKKNVGTIFTIKIPLTLAIVDGMEISVGGIIFTLPITSIKQSFKIADPQQLIYNTDGSEMIMLRGSCYPVIRLHQLFGIDTSITDLMEGIVIQIEYGTQVGCIFADELIGEQQVVVKPFPQFLNKYNVKNCGLSGCTILGDGCISLILDANNLLHYLER